MSSGISVPSLVAFGTTSTRLTTGDVVVDDIEVEGKATLGKLRSGLIFIQSFLWGSTVSAVSQDSSAEVESHNPSQFQILVFCLRSPA